MDPAALISLGERVLQAAKRIRLLDEDLIRRGWFIGSSGLARKDLREPQGALQIPPLRYASVPPLPVGTMTRGEG